MANVSGLNHNKTRAQKELKTCSEVNVTNLLLILFEAIKSVYIKSRTMLHYILGLTSINIF